MLFLSCVCILCQKSESYLVYETLIYICRQGPESLSPPLNRVDGTGTREYNILFTI